MILPDAGVGAVLLTNADNGGMLLYPFRRRLVEVLYDEMSVGAKIKATFISQMLLLATGALPLTGIMS